MRKTAWSQRDGLLVLNTRMNVTEKGVKFPYDEFQHKKKPLLKGDKQGKQEYNLH